MEATTGNAATIERFYRALDQGDAATMVACYAPDVTFSDPAFGELHGAEAAGMWTMLCEQATDLDVEVSAVEADGDTGSAHWDARYTFGATGRPVLNRIDARFRFRDGLIVEHRDSFSMWAWSRQALGPPAFMLGWNPIGRAMFTRKARARLEDFMAKRGAGA
jgi:ketosteroid isomerase-like protein